MEKIIPELPDGPILDLCAAPGGKTTSIINAIVGSEADGRPVVANEYNPQRANILRENLLKWGYPDIVVTNAPAEAYARYAGAFSLIAVDAPCSGEGMMRKEEMARSQWSTSLVEQCAALQRDILTNAVDALAPGGFLIFSTCTINVHENEENLKWLIEETGLEPVSPSLPDEWHIPRQLCGPYPALRFLPHLTRSEGLFCAMLRKPDSSTSRRKNFSLADFKGKVLANGYPDAVKKGKDLIPAPEAPLNINFDLSQYPVYDADLDTALMYLRRETLVLPPDTPRGWVVIAYQGHPLGFVKNLGNRANNQYPKEWRIRNL